ncbi:MAG: efflux RND transporter periplasmic adaptor subunit [Xanthobacteraceae bacterium]|nr:efflux RND transporter periplasmic adaptor subunit [Xanthobacteraceae bacterium]
MNVSVRNAVLGVIGLIAIVLVAIYLMRPANVAKTKADAHDDHGGAVELSDAKIAATGIELVKVASGTLRDTLALNGVVTPNQEMLVQVTPRFPGVVTEIRKRVGDRVEKGEVIAKIESNQSLTVYEIKAAISGTVIERQVALGEYASEQKAAFTIADLSSVWVDLAISRRDLTRTKMGDVILIESGDGSSPIEAKLSYISPVSNADTQSVLARAVVANDPIRLRPGLFVTARLVLQAKEAPLVVKLSALQTIENRTVVFVRNGNKFEPRDVELGDRDAEHVEVLFGLVEGDIYAAKNSFVIKAELAKGSAAHEH